MPGLQRLVAILLAGGLGVSITGALGVPLWRNWPPGDGIDIVMFSMTLVWVLTMRAAK